MGTLAVAQCRFDSVRHVHIGVVYEKSDRARSPHSNQTLQRSIRDLGVLAQIQRMNLVIVAKHFDQRPHIRIIRVTALPINAFLVRIVQ